jgi:hypothetical protein
VQWAGSRRRRAAQVRQPMIELLSDLADMDSWYEDSAVWHYASTAFWWQNQCAIVRVARNVVIGFRFSLDGLRIGPGDTTVPRASRCSARRSPPTGAGGRWRISWCRWPRTGMRSSAKL